jgi:hypothetical protein
MPSPTALPRRAARLAPKTLLAMTALLAVSLSAARADAACCTGFTQQCAGTKSVWCVQSTAPAGTLPTAFCAYGDEVVSELETLFNIQAPSTFEFDVDWPANGGAHTGTECGTFGDSVTGDAFTNSSYNVTGFYGYLLALHEAINDWTGLTTGGWPTDYWADHVSGFPNELDWRIMGTLGASLGDANLIAASPAQKARFWPGGDSEDSRVQMFDNIFTQPKMGNGYDGFSRIFSYVKGDNISWDDVATNGANPDQRRSEYVAAYLSLGTGESVLPNMQTPSAGYQSTTSWAICNGQWDGVTGDPNPSYTCSEANIDAIATAHCSIAANGKPAADLASLQAGNYGAVKSGPCGATCPSECGCKSATNECVAPWLGDAQSADGGVAAPDGGAAPPDGGTIPPPVSGGGPDASLAADGGALGSGSDDGGSAAAASSSGCSCRTVGSTRSKESPLSALFAAGALGAFVLARRRTRRR